MSAYRAAGRPGREPASARAMLALSVAALASLGGCSHLAPRLTAPTLTLTSVTFLGGSLQDQHLQLTLHVENPNSRSIPVASLEAHLDLAGQPFATGVSDAAFTLPPDGQTDVVLDVTANLGNGLAIAADAMLRRSVDYHLYGQVHLRSLLVHTLHFNQNGRVRLR